MDSIITLIALLLIFGILVFIHELGHFLAAKLNGVVVDEFALGFGKTLWQKHWKGTDYKLNLIPLGGYVKLQDEAGPEDGQKPTVNSFYNKPLRVKVLVFVAGVVMNIILAIILFAIYLGLVGYKTTLIQIINFNFIGAEKTEQYFPITIDNVLKDGAAEQAHIPADSSIVEVDHVRFQRDDEFRALLLANKGKTIDLTIYDFDDNTTKTMPVNLPNKDKELLGVEISVPRFGFYLVEYPHNVFSGISHTINMALYQLPAIGKLISLSIEKSDASYAASSVSGIVGVSAVVNDLVATKQFIIIINLAALVSISLALINILPLPILDGGQVFLAVLEKIRKQPFKRETIERINFVSFIAIVALTVVITAKDVWQFNVVGNLLETLRKVFGL